MPKSIIQEDNETLIAKFMGLMVFKSYEEMQAYPIEKLTAWTIPNDPKWSRNYHNDWNKLMPVVEKIESNPLVDICIFKEATQIRVWSGDDEETFVWKCLEPSGSSKIDHVYRAILKYIEYFNSLPQ